MRRAARLALVWVSMLTAGCGHEVVPTDAYRDPASLPIPADFRAMPSSVGVELVWTVTGEEFRVIDGWHLERGVADAGTTWVRLNSAVLQQSPFQDRTVEEGVTYCYRIRSVSPAGVLSLPSPPECVRVDLAPPEPPRNVRAEVVDDVIRVSWDPSPDEDVLDYRVYRLPPFPFLNYVQFPVGTEGFDDTTVEPDITYRYYLTAVDAFDNEGPESNVASATVRVNSAPGR